MGDLLKLYGVLLASNLMFSIFNWVFFFSRLKTKIYVIPIAGLKFDHWWSFTLGIWIFNAIFCYIPATFLVALGYRMSLQKFGGLYSGFLMGHVVALFTSVLLLKLIVGEVPNKNGWIALILIVIASFFAVNSGRSA